jgi:hypothetical protein
MEPRGVVLVGDIVDCSARDGRSEYRGPAAPQPPGRNLCRLLKRLEHEDSDHCMGCGRGFQHQDRTAIGYTGAGVMMGACCRAQMVSIIGGTVFLRTST